jgi:hypothetical protein
VNLNYLKINLKKEENVKVLFIGNSYTYYNDMPRMLCELAGKAGKKLEVDSITSPGKSLEWHWYNPATLDKLESQKWHFVILQDHSIGPVEEPERLLRIARRFSSKIKKCNSEMVLFLTWARQNIPEMQQDIITNINNTAKVTKAKIAPVGIVWQKVLETIPSASLHTEDKSHPNFLGSYLAACVFYSSLFSESPFKLPEEFEICSGIIATVNKEIASIIKTKTWECVQR